MRVSIQEAVRLGWIKPPEKNASQKNKYHAVQKVDPQKRLFDALKKAMPDTEILYEAKGVIPRRQFRIDIFIPSTRIAIEMDGFQYHRSKAAFQSDRMRQNILVENNIAVLRFFTKQILNSLDECVNMIKNIHLSREFQKKATFENPS